ncbi:MAG: hypothetical protein A2293_01860 [Elusimicrobia bacterium RIFOXYB2_FULL_49_7]|nr:MAG: hypothetical protein A2293_01860 [Elusimicrobia bacterium RIFOXYB2_FULL_49_7]
MKIFLLCLLLLPFCSRAVELHLSGPLPAGWDSTRIALDYESLVTELFPVGQKETLPLTLIFTTVPLDRTFGLPEWGGGGALGRDTVVVSLRMRPFLELSPERILRHELVHIALHRLLPNARLPRWFHEGMAMHFSGEMEIEEHVTLSKAIFTHSLVPLSSIDSVNLFSRFRADLAYCESHLAVAFLIRTYGRRVLPELLSNIDQQGDFADAFYDTFGLTESEMEKMFREDLIKRYHLVFLFADTYLFWTVGVVLFLIAVIAVKRRNRKTLRKMEADETLENT